MSSAPTQGVAASAPRPQRFRSFFITPANQPAMIRKLARPGADVVVVDLEDGTPLPDKEAAREQAIAGVRELLDQGIRSRIFIRSNAPGTPWIDGDLECVVRAHGAGLCVPKTGTVEEVIAIERRLRELEREAQVPPVETILGIESVAGVQNAVEIARAATRAVALYFGGEDYATDLLGERTVPGDEILYARARVAIAARQGGLAAFDTATLEFRDDDRFRRVALKGREMGYQGAICIHPDQVELAHEVFTPSAEEIDRAQRLLDTFHASLEEGIGVCSFEGQMIDGPLVKRAEQIVSAGEQNAGASAGGPPSGA